MTENSAINQGDEREAFESWIHTFDLPPRLEGEVFTDERYPNADCFGQFVYDDHYTQRCWAAWQARAAQPASVAVPDGYFPAPARVVMPDNLASHRASWLNALARLVELEHRQCEASDEDLRGYWQHELQAMRDMYADLDRLNSTPPASPDTGELVEALKSALRRWYYQTFEDDMLEQMQKHKIIAQAEGFSITMLANLEVEVDEVLAAHKAGGAHE